MRATFICTLVALALCLSICFASLTAIDFATREMAARCEAAIAAAEADDLASAKALLDDAAAYWQDQRGVLEILASHEVLQDISDACTEAHTALKLTDTAHFAQTMALLLSTLEDLQAREHPFISNIL